MKLKDIITKFIRSPFRPDRHCARICETIDELFAILSATTEHDRKSVYIYKGSASVLAAIVSHECGMGEKDISPLSLIYADIDRQVGDYLQFDEAFLEPCIVGEIKNKNAMFGGHNKLRFEKASDGKTVELKKAVICSEAVYLTTK